ncbi:MAG: hypothetical protein M3167_09945 [Acidobacteriota bacterium]|nr:hypothetical protein [Acidobacteriota bacterium]
MDAAKNPNGGFDENPYRKDINTYEQKEGPVARTIEQQTAKLPSDVWLWAAIASMVTSLGLQIAGEKKVSNFIGQWAPTLLIFGVYNKLVKVAGSDRFSR